jgi:hypothetical protein
MRERIQGFVVLSRVRLGAERVSFGTPWGRSGEPPGITFGFRK